MNFLIGIVLLPLGFAAAFIGPMLKIFGGACYVCAAFAYLNPGWVDIGFSQQLFGFGAGCSVCGYATTRIETLIDNRLL